MNTEIEPVHIGQEDDIEIGSVENFEHEEIDYAIFRLETGFLQLKVIALVQTRLLLVKVV